MSALAPPSLSSHIGITIILLAMFLGFGVILPISFSEGMAMWKRILLGCTLAVVIIVVVITCSAILYNAAWTDYRRSPR